MYIVRNSFKSVQPKKDGVISEKLVTTVMKDYPLFDDSLLYPDNYDGEFTTEDCIYAAMSNNLDEAIIFVSKKNLYLINVVKGTMNVI